MSKHAPQTLLQGLAMAFGRSLAVTTGARIAPAAARSDADSAEPPAETSAAVAHVAETLRNLLEDRLEPIRQRLAELEARPVAPTETAPAVAPAGDGEQRLRAEFRQSLEESGSRWQDAVDAVQQRVSALEQRHSSAQEELPGRLRALIDALRDTLSVKLALDLDQAVEAAEQRLRAELDTRLGRRQEALDNIEASLEQTQREYQELSQRGHSIDTSLNAVRAEQERLLSSVESRLHAVQPDIQRKLQFALDAQMRELEANLRASMGLSTEPVLAPKNDEVLSGRLEELEERLKAQAAELEALRRQQSSAEQNLLFILSGRGGQKTA